MGRFENIAVYCPPYDDSNYRAFMEEQSDKEGN